MQHLKLFKRDARITTVIKQLCLKLLNLTPHFLHLSSNWITIYLKNQCNLSREYNSLKVYMMIEEELTTALF